MPDQINISFYAELNNLLPTTWRNSNFNYGVKKPRSVKDLIESIGVPHSEIDLIIIDGNSVDFSHPIQGGEHINVYPASSKVDISPLKHNQPKPLPGQGFVLDVHLGRLAAYLRMTGFDTLYRNDYDDPTLADISARQNRILITCDRKLLMRKKISYGYFMRSRTPSQQILEVLSRFDLFDQLNTLTRCMQCNGLIQRVNKKEIEMKLLPLTKKNYDIFHQCNSCERIYWKGSHYEKMQLFLQQIKLAAEKNLEFNAS